MERSVLEKIKQGIIFEAKQMREINKAIPVNGTRIQISANNRRIEAVYYKAETNNAPLLVCMHGGGFLFGGCALDDKMWNEFRNLYGVNVISIEYRKSPEFQYPAALVDVYDAVEYLIDHVEEYGFDSDKIAVFGASAGATLAAAVCLYAKESGKNYFKFQLLEYPFLDCATDPVEKGMIEEESGPFYLFNEMYVGNENPKKATISPVFATRDELSGLPPAYIVIAEKDSLRAEAELYEKHLNQAGISVRTHLAKNMGHGYIEFYYNDSEEGFLPAFIPEARKNGSLEREVKQTLLFFKQAFEEL